MGLVIFEFVLVVLAALFVVTQLLVPAIQGTKSFPMFRTEESKLQAELIDIAQAKREQNLANIIRQEKKEVVTTEEKEEIQ